MLSPILPHPEVGLTFHPISDTAISSSGTKAVRPDTVLLGGKFYVAYLQLAPVRTFRLIVLNKDLMVLGTTNLFSGKNEPTDIRVAGGPGDFLSYAFETTTFQKGIPNHLNIAQYRLTDSFPLLVTSKTEVAVAMPVVPPDNLPGQGDDLVDDPTPFVHGKHFYVVTRKWETVNLTIRECSADLGRMETRDLDLSTAFPGLFLSVNSLVDIEGRLYLISGVSNGPPIGRRFFSYIAAIGLDEAMTKNDNPIVLSRTPRYEDYVACARYSGGILFVGYDSREYEIPKP